MSLLAIQQQRKTAEEHLSVKVWVIGSDFHVTSWVYVKTIGQMLRYEIVSII